MSFTVGIVGAGLAGRLFALACIERGWQVTLFDQDDCHGRKSCGYVAAGMLAPYSELETSESLVFDLGRLSMTLWPRILQQLIAPVTCDFSGTLLVAHPQDTTELKRFHSLQQRKCRLYQHDNLQIMTPLSREKLEILAPGLSPTLQAGYWIAQEGYMNSAEFFSASTKTLQAHQVTWHENTQVSALKPHEVPVANQRYHFDLVCDTRGLGAKADWPQLRGVRGELVWLQAPLVTLHCPVRLLHPRYPIYISPRGHHTYVVGATIIESEDLSPISVESTLELLSAAYTVHPGFAEARLINTLTQARPSFVDHQPRIAYSKGLLRMNGLYRHGYLIGPAVVEEALRLVTAGENSLQFSTLLGNVTCK